MTLQVRKIWRITFVSCVTLLLIGTMASAQSDASCQRHTTATLASPDAAWLALVQEDTCVGVFPFTTGVTDTVQLVRPGEQPDSDNDVFALEEHGRPENRPLLRWLSPQKLQITVPNRSLIGLQKRAFAGVEIVVKYDPDDPAERARFLQELGLAPK
jgi:hypothetical protein